MDWEKDRDRLRGREAEHKERLSIILLILLLSTIMYVNIVTVGFWVVHFMFRHISLRGVWEWGEDLFPLHCFSLFSYLLCLHLSGLLLFFVVVLLHFFPPITELGPGCLDQCHHSGWRRGGRAQRFPGRLNGLCGCLSSFWVFSYWLAPHLSGELTRGYEPTLRPMINPDPGSLPSADCC